MRAESKSDRTDGYEMLKEMLNGLQRKSQQRIKALRKDQAQDSEPGPADEMDSANATEEVETHAGLIAREEEKLNCLDEALARINTGKYGKCLKCHEPIPFERLRAVPFASYCVDGLRLRAAAFPCAGHSHLCRVEWIPKLRSPRSCAVRTSGRCDHVRAIA